MPEGGASAPPPTGGGVGFEVVGFLVGLPDETRLSCLTSSSEPRRLLAAVDAAAAVATTLLEAANAITASTKTSRRTSMLRLLCFCDEAETMNLLVVLSYWFEAACVVVGLYVYVCWGGCLENKQSFYSYYV